MIMKIQDYKMVVLPLAAILLSVISPFVWAAPAGKLIAWGHNGFGQTNVPPGDDFVAIATHSPSGHALALRSDGSLAGWGLNQGVQELGSADIFYGQAIVPAGNDFKAIAVGTFHSLALRSNGTVVAWGANEIFGNGDFTGQATVPAGLSNAVAIAAGDFHSVALKSDGSLVAWGDNESGKTNAPSGNDFVAIAAGDWHSLALKSDGSIVVWGEDEYAQVRGTPRDTNFVAIAAGAKYSLALKSDGSMAAWGGIGAYSAVAARAQAGTNFVAIAGGANHSLALKSDGSMIAWGSNYGVDGTAGIYFGQAVPRPGTNFIAIAASDFLSLAIQVQAPALTIVPAVHLSWPTATNKAYQIQISTNLPGNWTPTGELIEGTGGTLGAYFTATNGQRLFRIQETTASDLSWLDGTWAGSACLTPPLEEYSFQLVADTTNRVFRTTLSFSSGPPCTGTLRLLSSSSGKAEFHESVIGSGCADDTVVFTRLNSRTIAYTFVQTNPPQTGSGILTRQ